MNPSTREAVSSERQIARHARRAQRELESRLEREAPFAAPLARRWMQGLSGEPDASAYFLGARAFPLLRLTRWFAQAQGLRVDERFEAALAHSSLCGGYYVRLVDNVMDEDRAEERALLPLLHVFHLQFTRPYTHIFSASHAFWSDFARIWSHMADATLEDAQRERFDRAAFERVSARKVAAAEIPLTAAAYHYDRRQQLPAWLAFLDVLGRWYQLFNDLRDWRKDHSAGAPTWLSSEARRHGAGDSTHGMAVYMQERGLPWATQHLQGWFEELCARAAALGCGPAQAFVTARWALFQSDLRELRATLSPMRSLLEAFGP